MGGIIAFKVYMYKSRQVGGGAGRGGGGGQMFLVWNSVGSAGRRNGGSTAGRCSVVAGWRWGYAVRVGTGGLLLLGLVADEVDLGLAGLGGGRRRDDDVGLFVGTLDQDVDERFLFVLRLEWDDGGGGRRGGRRLDEHDLVVFLGWGEGDGATVRATTKNGMRYVCFFLVSGKGTSGGLGDGGWSSYRAAGYSGSGGGTWT